MPLKLNVFTGNLDYVNNSGTALLIGTDLALPEGSWQIVADGAELLVQRMESGVWVTKGTFLGDSGIPGSGGAADSTIYVSGDSTTDGSWRLTVDGATLSVQYRTGGSWIETGAFS